MPKFRSRTLRIFVRLQKTLSNNLHNVVSGRGKQHPAVTWLLLELVTGNRAVSKRAVLIGRSAFPITKIKNAAVSRRLQGKSKGKGKDAREVGRGFELEAWFYTQRTAAKPFPTLFL